MTSGRTIGRGRRACSSRRTGRSLTRCGSSPTTRYPSKRTVRPRDPAPTCQPGLFFGRTAVTESSCMGGAQASQPTPPRRHSTTVATLGTTSSTTPAAGGPRRRASAGPGREHRLSLAFHCLSFPFLAFSTCTQRGIAAASSTALTHNRASIFDNRLLS